MKRNRTQALDHVLEHRKKVIKGLGALIQILESFPDGITGTDLLAARKMKLKSAKAKSKSKLAAKKSKPKNAPRPAPSRKTAARRRSAPRSPAAPTVETAPGPGDQRQSDSPAL